MGGWWWGRPELKETSLESSSRTSSSASLLSLAVTRPSPPLPQVPNLHGSQHPEGENCAEFQPVRIWHRAPPWLECCASAATGAGTTHPQMVEVLEVQSQGMAGSPFATLKLLPPGSVHVDVSPCPMGAGPSPQGALVPSHATKLAHPLMPGLALDTSKQPRDCPAVSLRRSRQKDLPLAGVKKRNRGGGTSCGPPRPPPQDQPCVVHREATILTLGSGRESSSTFLLFYQEPQRGCFPPQLSQRMSP